MGLDSIVPSVLNFISSLSSPIQILLLVAVVFVIRKILKAKFDRPIEEEPERPIEAFNKKRDFTLEELVHYDGVKSPYVLMSVNGKVFDVTRAKDFYGPGGPYSNFAGRDASRGLATFSLGPEAITNEYDDLSDLNGMQMDSLREWETQFFEKYDLVGRYLKPGEKHQQYEESETEEEDGKSSKKDD